MGKATQLIAQATRCSFFLTAAAMSLASCGGDGFSTTPQTASDSGSNGGAAGTTVTGGAAGNDASTSGGSAGVGGSAGAPGEGGLDAKPDAPITGLPCDPVEQVDETSGVFVSHDTGDENGNGSALGPVKTLAKALQIASTLNKKTVYVDVGVYPEKVVFTSAEAGIILRGGFTRKGATWERDCQAHTKTLLQSPEAIAVQVIGTTTASGLRELTITTKASGSSVPDGEGESIYAVHVTGDNTKFSLTGVSVVAGDGGKGGLASPGTTPGAATGTCGTSNQSCGDGGSGVNGATVLPASEGTFSAAGYAPGTGQSGQNGLSGNNGAAGPAQSQSPCTQCSGCGALHCNCACCQSGCGNWCEGGNKSEITVTTQPGPCGCHGQGAKGGQPGRGGGASVALFAAGNTTVSVSYSSLVAGEGGAGSPGGNGAPGGEGSSGTSSVSSCETGDCKCDFVGCGASCGTTGSTIYVVSSIGAKGGKGGSSSKGGGGAGGPSYAAVLIGGATLVDDHATLVPDNGGAGADGAPNGSQGPKLAIP